MEKWDEIRDEIAGMLADGKPLKDVLAKLEQRKNEMAKANLLKAMDDMKKQKQTNEEYIKSLNTEQLAEWLQEHMDCSNCDCNKDLCYKGYDCCELAFLEWLKQPHQ